MNRRRWFSGSIVVLLVSALFFSGCLGTGTEKGADSFFTDVTAAFRSFDATRIVNLVELPKLNEDEQKEFDEGLEELQKALNNIRPAFDELTVKFTAAPGEKIEIAYNEDKNEAVVENAALSVVIRINKNKFEQCLKDVWDSLDPDYLEEEFYPYEPPTWDEFWNILKEEIEWDEWDGRLEYPDLELPAFMLIKVNNKWKLPLEEGLDDYLDAQCLGCESFDFKRIIGIIFAPFFAK